MGVNLYITNIGFGEEVVQFKEGKLAPQLNAGLDARKVRFYHDSSDASYAKVGEQTVWSWPFPEAATVAQELQISGSSSVGMGTAPEVWNVMIGFLAQVVPRSWWKNEGFSRFLADFSRPLV